METEEELGERKQQAINVTYVNFDKTKPHAQKQIGDGLSETSTKTKSIKSNGKCDSSKQQIQNLYVDSGKSKEKMSDKDMNKIYKTKSKRLNSSDTESQLPLTKQSKKHKFEQH